jgi:hypothetical protein
MVMASFVVGAEIRVKGGEVNASLRGERKQLLPAEKPPKTEHDRSDSSPRMNLRELHYYIQIILPDTRDVAVFDAIFESLRKHLLWVSMDDQLYSFGFRGLLTEQALDGSGRQPRLLQSETVIRDWVKQVGA